MRLIGRIAAVAAAGSIASDLAVCSISIDSTASDTVAAGKSDVSETVTGSTGVPKGDDSKTIYLVSKSFQHRFWQAVRGDAEQAGTEFNYEIRFVGPGDETRVTQQLDQLQAALDMKPTAIGLAAPDSGATGPPLTQIGSVGTPFVAFDPSVNSDPLLTTVSTSNYAAAEEATRHMIGLPDGQKGTVGLICHSATSTIGEQRCEGFKNYFEKNAPSGLRFLNKQIAGEVGKAADTLKAIIQASSGIVGMCGSNKAAVSGAIQGATESGKKPVVVGSDSNKTQTSATKNGFQAGAVTQAPKFMGYKIMTAATQAINGIALPKIVDSGFYWYDKFNIDSGEIKSSLYE